MKHLICTYTILTCIFYYAYGQTGSVGIGTTTPDPSAVLDITSDTSGILIPRMTDTERDAIANPATGLMVFITTDSAFYYFDGSAWITFDSRTSMLTDADGDTKIQVEESPDEDKVRIDVLGTESVVIEWPGYVGLGTDTPHNRLDVNGSAVIGASYAGTNSAPLNGLLVEGNVGIGVTDPDYALEVNGIFETQLMDSYDKIRVYPSSAYSIGAKSGQTLGFLNGWATTFTMTNSSDFGWKWRDSGDAVSDGAMSLTTDGRLYVKSTAAFNGYVGIGTTNPLSKLHVATFSQGEIRLENDDTGVYSVWSSHPSDPWIGTSTAHGFGLVTDLTYRLFVASNGNIGIGNMSPNYSLEMGSGGVISLNDGNLRNVRGVYMKDWDDDTGGSDSKYQLIGRDGAWMFYSGGVVVGSYLDGTWSDVPTGNLIVEGYVGCGTTDPSGSLDIESADDAQTELLINNTGIGDPTIRLQLNGSTQFTLGVDNSDDDKFKINNGSSLGTADLMTITSTGEIGIGTNTPDDELDILGASPVIELSNTSESESGIRFTDADDPTGQRYRIYFDSNTGNNLNFWDSDDLQARFRQDASAQNDNGWATATIDYGEFMEKVDPDEQIEVYDVVAVKGNRITKNTEGSNIIMITSTDGGLRGGNPMINGYSREEDPNWMVCAFIGQMPVLVSGEVHEGDYIIPSGQNDGQAIAVPPADISRIQFNQVIGRALEGANDDSFYQLDRFPHYNEEEATDETYVALERMHLRKGDAHIVNVAVGLHNGLPAFENARIEKLEKELNEIKQLLGIAMAKSTEE